MSDQKPNVGFSMAQWEKTTVEERDKTTETAFLDPLTGAKSKHAYLISEKEFDKSIEEGRAQDFAVVVCDVNGLKITKKVICS